jgi:hypothetical protein
VNIGAGRNPGPTCFPRGFVRIRHFGLLANRFRASHLALCQRLLAPSLVTQPMPSTASEKTLTWHCPRCRTLMIVKERFTAAELSRCNYFDSS